LVSINTIASLAMLKVNEDHGRGDYFESVLPFVTFVVATKEHTVISSENVRNGLIEVFGLVFPYHVVERALRRLERRGVLSRVDGALTLVERPDTSYIEEAKARNLSRQRQLIGALTAYVKSTFGASWDEDEAAGYLLDLVTDFTIDFLKHFEGRGILSNETIAANETRVMLAAFVEECNKNKDVWFDATIELVRGNMLANGLLCEDLSQIPENLHKTRFYLDTPLLLDLVDTTTRCEKEVATECIGLVRRLKGSVATFDHVVRETERVLENCERRFDDDGETKDRVISGMKSRRRTRSDLSVIRGGLRRRLADLGVAVEALPRPDAGAGVDESALRKALAEKAGYLHGEKALQTDLESVKAIYYLRHKSRPRRIDDAKAVFVTSNQRFAAAAYEYGNEQQDADEVSPVVTDYSLTNLAWLRLPLQAPDVPRLELIAECHVLMRPPEELWQLYVVEVNRLYKNGTVSESDHAILKYSLEAQDELMRLTRGSDANFNVSTVPYVLANARREMVEGERKNTEEQRRRASQAESEVKRLKSRERQRRRVLARWAVATANLLSFFVVSIVTLGLATCALLGQLLPTWKEALQAKSYALLMPGILLIGWFIYSCVTGKGLMHLRRLLKRRIARRVMHLLKRLSGEQRRATLLRPVPEERADS
jgi:hypothetical protein